MSSSNLTMDLPPQEILKEIQKGTHTMTEFLVAWGLRGNLESQRGRVDVCAVWWLPRVFAAARSNVDGSQPWCSVKKVRNGQVGIRDERKQRFFLKIGERRKGKAVCVTIFNTNTHTQKKNLDTTYTYSHKRIIIYGISTT